MAETAVVRPSEFEELGLDDRGLLYIKHGEPARIIRSTGASIYPNETWVYDSPRRVLHFVARSGDFRLTDNILTAFEFYPADVHRDLVDFLITREATAPMYRLLEDRAAVDPLINSLRLDLETLQQRVHASVRQGVRIDQLKFLMAQANSPTAEYARRIVDVSAKTAQVAYEMAATRDASLKYADPVPFFYDIYRFRGEGNMVQVTAATAIPGVEFTPDTTSSFLIYAPRIILTATDARSGTAEAADTTLRLRSHRALQPGEYINTFVQVASAADSVDFRISVRDAARPGAGQTYGGALPLREIRADVAISDVVFATTRDGRWKRGSVAIDPIPPAQVARDSAFRVFYEIYGLSAGEPYDTELVIEQREQRGIKRMTSLFRRRDRVAMKFTGEAPPGKEAVQELRSIGNGLVAGKYILTVRISARGSGRKVVRERLFEVN